MTLYCVGPICKLALVNFYSSLNWQKIYATNVPLLVLSGEHIWKLLCSLISEWKIFENSTRQCLDGEYLETFVFNNICVENIWKLLCSAIFKWRIFGNFSTQQYLSRDYLGWTYLETSQFSYIWVVNIRTLYSHLRNFSAKLVENIWKLLT